MRTAAPNRISGATSGLLAHLGDRRSSSEGTAPIVLFETTTLINLRRLWSNRFALGERRFAALKCFPERRNLALGLANCA